MNREINATPALSVKHLSVSIRGRQLLKDFNFTVETGAIVGIIGPNGAGKSTLLKVLARVLPRQDGCIELGGQEIGELSRAGSARLIGYLPQQMECGLGYTVAEFLEVSLLPFSLERGIDERGRAAAVAAALELVGISSLRECEIFELSAGEKQLALLAAALVHQPRMLLLDEPCAFLDPVHAQELTRILLRLTKEGQLTVLLVEHDLNRIIQIASHLLALRDGRLSFSGETSMALEGDLLHRLFGTTFVRVPVPGRADVLVMPGGNS